MCIKITVYIWKENVFIFFLPIFPILRLLWGFIGDFRNNSTFLMTTSLLKKTMLPITFDLTHQLRGESWIHREAFIARFCLHTNFLSFPAFPKYFASPSLCLNQATCPTVSHTVDGVLTSLMQQHKDATSLSVNQSHMKTKRIKSAKGLSRNKAIITSVVCVIMYWMWSNM